MPLEALSPAEDHPMLRVLILIGAAALLAAAALFWCFHTVAFTEQLARLILL